MKYHYSFIATAALMPHASCSQSKNEFRPGMYVRAKVKNIVRL